MNGDTAAHTLLSRHNPAMLFLRLYSLLEQRQRSTPDRERQDVIQRLRPLRNKIAHNTGLDESEWALVGSSVAELVDYLRLVESSSLGSAQAQTNRLLSTSAEIDDVLRRSPIRNPARTSVASTAEEPVDDSGPARRRDPLLELATRGDRQAIEQLLATIRPLVVRYCRMRLANEDPTIVKADDVAQEVCLAVLRALPNYRDEGRPFLAFVYGIASHKVADARRHATRDHTESTSEAPGDSGNEPGPEQRALQGELSNRVGRLLDRLPPRQREILVLRVVLGMSAEDTALAVGSTPGAVRVAQHRALVRLRKAMSTAEASSPDAEVAEQGGRGTP